MSTPRIYTVEEAQQLDLETILELNREFVNEALVDLIAAYKLPRRFVRAEGIRLWDDQGNEYLDFLCSYGALALGHNHPEVISAVERVRPAPNFFVISPGALTGALASSLSAIAPGDLQRSFFCNSGSEAIEGAIKLARIATGRTRIIAAHEGFHGKSLGALSVSGHEPFRAPYLPLVPNVDHVRFGDAAALNKALAESPTAAVVLEPIQGPAGIIVPPDGYLARVRELCTEHGALLILDEIQTGLGRTGRMFACQHDGVVPDVLCLSNGLSGGVYPIGAYITSDAVWRRAYGTKQRAALHSSTFGGNTFACAAALAAINITVDQDLPARAANLGGYFHNRLAELAGHFDLLKEVRGRGLMIGLDFRQTRNRLIGKVVNQAAAMVAVQMLHLHRIVSLYTFTNSSVIRLAPPLNVDREDLERYLDALEDVLATNRTFTRLAFNTARLVKSK
ncbi:MAG: aspartate aminotransferase family protein [Thermoanaerobaculales bacterium]|nr:aspartate aminotransferase family protein [Thermoanaerobaculales bacterium]